MALLILYAMLPEMDKVEYTDLSVGRRLWLMCLSTLDGRLEGKGLLFAPSPQADDKEHHEEGKSVVFYTYEVENFLIT